METKVTSKTSSLQALLLRAWRERWTDLQWGIQIKTILPRGVSGDVHNLADCILQQALVGPGPNQLVLSYLKHSLSSQLVSYAAVLQRISKYDGVHKPHCIISLLEFVEGILGRMTCRSRAEEGALATAVLSLVNWLLTITLHALYKVDELCTSPEHTTMLLRPTALLSTLLSCDFAKAMLCLAQLDDKELHSDVVRKCIELEAALSEAALSQSLNLKIGLNIEDIIRTLSQLRTLGPPGAVSRPPGDEDLICEPVTYCLQPLLAVEVLLNPSADTQTFVNQILMVQRIKGYSISRLYAEVMRACLISLKDGLGTIEQSHWGVFTFLKVPHILLQLHRHVRGTSQGSPEQPDFSQDIVDAVELLLQHTPLLDTVDVKCSCACVECLLTELAKVGLISEHLVSMYLAKRDGAVTAIQKIDSVAASAAIPIPKVIVRAEPTLARILTTLDADYFKIQDALLGVISQVLTGKSFELILAVATVQGKLRTFVSKLINFNECSRKPAADEIASGKGSLTRAMLFDVSFLMLCYIVQTYGSDVVLNEEGCSGDSFFEQWVRECMPERGHPKSPDVMLKGCDPSKVDALLSQFISPDMEFKTSQVIWHDVCRHVPAATRELLFAWEQGALSPTDVKRALDSMHSRMGCLSVCAAAWLCSYMQILDQDALLKPMNMVQQFLNPTDDMPQQDNYKERFGLTFQIIRKMQYDLHPPSISKAKLSHNIVSASPISEQLQSVWSVAHHRGWMNIEATHILESLLHTGGAQWFVSNIIKEVIKYRYRDDLDKAVDLAFALFHLDIEQCTLSLLQHLLPLYLHNQQQGEELVEPQASALAKLSAYCVFAALESPGLSNAGSSRSRKRARHEVDTEDLERMLPGSKVLRLRSTDSQDGTSNLMFEGGMSSSASCGSVMSEGGATEPVLREPLKKALNSLFQTFLVIAQDGEVSQHTHFVFKFLEFCVSCGKERARLVLQVMPGSLVPSLLSSLPDLFTTDLLLCLYDTSTAIGRRDTARDLCMLRNMTLQPPAASIREFTGQQA